MAGETGGLALATENKVAAEVGDRLIVFTREEKRKKL